MPRVATKGTVKLTLSPDGTANGKADSGTWTGGDIVEMTYARLTTKQGPVVYQASCIVTFAGTKGGNPVSIVSKVTLKASATTLQHGASYVLVDGDSAQDEDGYGNMLTVHAVARLSAGSR
jgi:hypothetical protein